MEDPLVKIVAVLLIVLLHIALLIFARGKIGRMFNNPPNETSSETPIYVWGQVVYYSLGYILLLGVLERVSADVITRLYAPNPLILFAACAFIFAAMAAVMIKQCIEKGQSHLREQEARPRTLR